MKLLSMLNRGLFEGQSRAGILIGDEVLDVTAYCEIIEMKANGSKRRAALLNSSTSKARIETRSTFHSTKL